MTGSDMWCWHASHDSLLRSGGLSAADMAAFVSLMMIGGHQHGPSVAHDIARMWAGLLGLAVLRLLTGAAAVSLHARDGRIVSPSPKANFAGDDWALLIAGSSGWGNYRHQADICHVSGSALMTPRIRTIAVD